MADILSIGARSLLAIQQGLNTTSHNIANANTEGYSRQTVNFSAVQAQQYGFGYLGQGVHIESVQRSYDSFLTTQLRSFTSSQSRYQIFSELSARVDDIMGNSSSSINAAIQQFFSAVQDVSNSPSTLPERQALLGEAGNLVDRQLSVYNLLSDLNKEVNSDLRSAVTEINGLTNSIAMLNKEIVSATLSTSGASPNDLLDQRDRLVKQLSGLVSVNAVEQDDGALNLFIGNGLALVIGGESSQLQTQNNPYDSSKLEIAVAGKSNSTSISQYLSGGELQGLLDFRDRVLTPTQSELGLVMLGLSEGVNQQHQLGLDLNNESGAALFNTPSIQAHANVGNTGSVVPAVTLDDVGQLRASDYRLAYDGSQWQLTRLSDNTSVSGAGPLTLDGMTIDVSSGAAASGDSFLLNPARDAAGSIRLGISDPRKIAAASLLAQNTSINNTGTGVLDQLLAESTNSLPLSGPITLTFNPDALGAGIPGFDVSGGPGGTIAYDPSSESGGKTVTFAAEGISFLVSGVPSSGDSFVINNNIGAHGDNSNILQIGELQHRSLLNGAKDSYQEFYGAMVARVGVTNQQAKSNLQVENSMLQQATNYKENAAGVNLDEEAANMLRFQQQYQAAAQLIKVADEMFQSLLMSIR